MTDANKSEIIYINIEGEIESTTLHILTHVGGTIPNTLFLGNRYAGSLRVGYVRIFMDINTDCFWVVLYYLNEKNIMSPGSNPEKTCVRNDNFNDIW